MSYETDTGFNRYAVVRIDAYGYTMIDFLKPCIQKGNPELLLPSVLEGDENYGIYEEDTEDGKIHPPAFCKLQSCGFHIDLFIFKVISKT